MLVIAEKLREIRSEIAELRKIEAALIALERQEEPAARSTEAPSSKASRQRSSPKAEESIGDKSEDLSKLPPMSQELLDALNKANESSKK